MSKVKWIKIVVDIFDDEKILFIEQLPDADTIIVIWFKLLTLAGKINNGGVLLFNEKLAYTDEMLATIFRRPLSTVKLALRTFEEFEMVEIINDTLTIPNWSKHQSVDKLEEKKDYMRNYMQEYRKKQRLLVEKSDRKTCKVNGKVNGKVNVSRLDIDIEEDIDIDNIYTSAVLEPSTTPTADIFITLPLISKKNYAIYKQDVDAWQGLYPACDVKQELRKMAGWLDANPTNRKTERGIKRFVVNWLSREQDRAKTEKPQNPQKKGSAKYEYTQEQLDSVFDRSEI